MLLVMIQGFYHFCSKPCVIFHFRPKLPAKIGIDGGKVFEPESAQHAQQGIIIIGVI